MEDRVASYEPDPKKLKRYYEQARDTTQEARQEALIDVDYYDGYQWTPEERRALRERHQPDNVFNRVRPAVNGTIGVIKQGATDPRAYPRTPQDEDGADVASKTLRYIKDDARLDETTERGAMDYLVPGICAAIVEVDDDLRVRPTLIRFEEFFYDPHSRRHDFKDARFMGVAKWQWVDTLKAKYPDKAKEISGTLEASPLSDDTNEDRPKHQVTWADRKAERVLTVEIYHNDGGWKRCVFTDGVVLEAAESPYQDDKGRPTNPIEAQSCYVDRDNRRMGIVRDMRGPQDEINKRRSKLLNESSNRQVIQTQLGADVSAEQVRKEASRADGVIPYGYQPVARPDVFAGQMQLLAHATQEIERYAPNPAQIGRDGEGQSGRARLIRQQAGLTEQAIIFGGIEDWQLRIYRQCWMRARQFWTQPMWIRVTDDEGAPEFIQINAPEMGPDGKVLGYRNAVAELDIDIILDSVPDTANLQAEQFAQLTEFAKLYGPEEVPFDDMLRLSTLPGKKELMEQRKARKEEAAQSQGPQQQLQMQGAEAAVRKTEAEATLTAARAANEIAKPQMEALKALQAAQQTPPPGV